MKTGQRRRNRTKNDRYSPLIGFINHLSHRERSGWKGSQTNFTTGVQGSLHTNQFLTRLESLGVKNKNTREAIRNRWNTPEPWTQMKTGQRRKVQEKNDRYNSLLGFINHLSHREKSGWKASQTNFTTRSTRLFAYKPVPYQTGVVKGKEQKHARSHTK